MLRYKIDVMQAINESGYSTYQIRKEKLIGENALQALRENKMIGIKALDQVCSLLKMQPGDVIEWTP
jgi:putative transcriptional regulator